MTECKKGKWGAPMKKPRIAKICFCFFPSLVWTDVYNMPHDVSEGMDVDFSLTRSLSQAPGA